MSLFSIPVQRNRPITPLKDINPYHEQVQELNLPKGSVDHFGIGYYGGDGMYHDSVVMPLHNASGELIAYSTLFISHDAVDDEWIVPDEGYLTSSYPEPQYFNPSIDIIGAHKLPDDSMSDLYMVRNPANMLAVWAKGGDCVVSIVNDVPSLVQVETVKNLVATHGARLRYVMNNEFYSCSDSLTDEMLITFVANDQPVISAEIDDVGRPLDESRVINFSLFS